MNEKVCSQVYGKEKCVEVPSMQCNDVPKEKCQEVPRMECWDEPSQVCTKVPK